MAARFLSPNPAKRRNELFVLVYSPVWMGAVGLVMLGRMTARLGEGGLLALGVGLALPLWLLPLALPSSDERGRPWLARHSTRFNLWIALLTFVQVYFGSSLFFDSLGMEYHFPVELVVNRTPLFLYFMTLAYFSTYFVVMQALLRGFRARFPSASRPVVLAAQALIAYGVAFAETAFMANDRLKEYFFYRDRGFTLLYGSICYGTLFLITLPLALRLDEEEGAPSSAGRLAWDLLAANMLILVCYEGYGAIIHWLR